MRLDAPAKLISGLAEENLRRVAARSTHMIAIRKGKDFPMWIGCGYPKSGTVWLCQLMAIYLGVPYPQNYYSPIAMQSVIHAHWDWDRRLPPTGYIIRDGRDVMVSFYFFHKRALTLPQDPSVRFRLRKRFARLYGKNFDLDDVQTNLPKFIESTMVTGPATRGVSWHEHVRDWAEDRHHNVSAVRYEDLLADTPSTLATLMSSLTEQPPSRRRAELAAERFAFAHTTGRSEGTEDRSSFQRKGVAGDWRNHFTRDAGEVYDHYAGEMLVRLGYAGNRSWYEAL